MIPDLPCILITQEDISEAFAEEWNIPYHWGPGFWYIPLDTELATYLTLKSIGRRTYIPGVAIEHMMKYPYPDVRA